MKPLRKLKDITKGCGKMKKSTLLLIAEILSALLGGAGFLLFLFALKVSFLVSVMLGIGLYIGFSFLLKPTRHKIGKIEISGMMDQEGAEKLLVEGQNARDEIKKAMENIHQQDVKGKAAKILTAIDKVFEYLEKNPEKVKTARKFFSYYLETTAKLLQKYEELEASNEDVNSAEIEAALKKIENVLGSIIAAFEKQLTSLLENDIIDIESEIALMENTIKMEGL